MRLNKTTKWNVSGFVLINVNVKEYKLINGQYFRLTKYRHLDMIITNLASLIALRGYILFAFDFFLVLFCSL